MSTLWRKAWTFILVYFAFMMEYQAELVLWVLANSLPIIMMGVWMQAAQEGQFGLSTLEFARYFIAVFLVRQLTIVWVIYEFEKQIVEGKLSPRLLQPIDPVWHHVAAHLSERLARTPFSILLTLGIFVLYPQAFWVPSFTQIILVTVAAILAFILRFLVQYTFAMLAFWIERASAIEQFWYLPYLFLSGLVAPLDLYPDAVREVVLWTPFPYVIYFPVSILTGQEVDLVQGFTAMGLWIVFWYGANRWLWRRGLRHYSGMGA